MTATTSEPATPPRAELAPVAALLISVAVLVMGNGLQGTLLPVRASLEAFSAIEIGLMGSAYYLGFVFGCLSGGRLIQRVGHIRAFTALAAVASTVTLVHAMSIDPLLWALLRATTGFCFAGLFIVAETWLNDKADNSNRGFVLGIYTMVVLSVTVVGQMMFMLDDPQRFFLFALVSILISLAAVPLALTASPQPAPFVTVRVRPMRLYRNSPVGFVGVFMVGLVAGAFWSLAPAFAAEVDARTSAIAVFMATASFGGALVQWPLGRLSDRFDRRIVLIFGCGIAAIMAVALAMVGMAGGWRLQMLSFLFGASALPLYAICAAHAFDFAQREDFIEISAGLLLANGAGSVFGPLAAAGMIQWIGPGGLFLTVALMYGVLALFVVWRMAKRAPPAEEDRISFDLVTTAPTLATLEPELADVEAGRP